MRRRRRTRKGQEKRKRENGRPILMKLCAALLRSFRLQHSEKMKGSGRGNWDPREGPQPFRPNPNGAGDRTTTLRRQLIGAANLSSSSASGPEKVAYPMLKHLPRSGMDLLLHIFNLSWSSHSFPSNWKTSSIIPIHKMGKPLDSPAFFRPVSLTSCVSKLFERIILSRLLFFLESNSILSPPPGRFPPWTVYT